MSSSRVNKLRDRLRPRDRVLCIGFMAHNVEGDYSLQSKMDKGDVLLR